MLILVVEHISPYVIAKRHVLNQEAEHGSSTRTCAASSTFNALVFRIPF